MYNFKIHTVKSQNWELTSKSSQNWKFIDIIHEIESSAIKFAKTKKFSHKMCNLKYNLYFTLNWKLAHIDHINTMLIIWQPSKRNERIE